MGSSASGASEAKRVADECARGVLDVSLSAARLSNLQKARLLDVLLWAGDIPGWELRRDSGLQVKVRGKNAGAVSHVG
jgi:hypothetical protein